MNKSNKLSWDLTPRQLCDLEMLLSGAFAPLKGFLNQPDYDSVVESMRLANGILWPIPITLDVQPSFAEKVQVGETIELRDPEGVLLAHLQLESIWTPNKTLEAEKVFGSNDLLHPGVYYLQHKAGSVYLGGAIETVELPQHYDYRQHRHTPAELKALFKKLGWHKVVAFQTRNPMHRAHQELTFRAARELEANLLLHPVVGMTKPGDIDHFTRVRCYEQLIKHYPEQTTFLSLLHLAMRMAGPREAVWHALIRKNYGCTHFIIGRDHAGPGKNSQGQDFYAPYAAQELAKQFEAEMGIQIISFENMVYVQDRAEYLAESEVAPGELVLNILGTEFRRRLREGLEIPTWFSYPEVISELRRSYPPRHQQGFTVFFTGLSGSGKSTVANALLVKLMEMGGRPVTLLDGDVVRKNLSSELSFSKEHRDLNIRRIGFVASEITKNGGIAICAPIAPYSAVRREVRELVENYGGFIEIHVATPIEECERRDRKGLYAKARAGLVKGFTGIDDPYEAPEQPELKLDTSEITPDECAHKVLLTLERLGFIKY